MSMVDAYIEQLADTFKNVDGKDAKYSAAEAQAASEEGKEILEQLKAEIPGLTDKAKKDFANQKVKYYKDLISSLNRQVLTGTTSSSSSIGEGMSAQERASDGLDKLRAANRDLAETEKVAVDTHSRLQQQTEQLKGIKGKGEEINKNVSYSNKLLNRMSQWWRG